MNQGIIEIFFALLHSAVCGTKLEEQAKNKCTSELLQSCLKMSAQHDLQHLLALGLKQNGLISKENTAIKRHIHKAVYRYERLEQDYGKLCNVLENAKIPFLPLKGSMLRKYYPEPWMRTSCDLDILVHKEHLEKATGVLVGESGYTFHEEGTHDIAFFTPAGSHIELHFTLVEDGIANESSAVLKNVWESATLRDGTSFWYEMPDDVFYFYHIAHMAKHFENGGCGIRPLLDLWILDNIPEADVEKRNVLLQQGGLLRFAEVSRKLSRIWLEKEEYDPVTKEVENYILRGGVYGCNENHVVVQQQKKGGRLKYALSKIWLPASAIQRRYPITQKHRWLIPFMEVYRWFGLVFGGHLKRTAKELKYNSSVSNTTVMNTKKMLQDIGL